MSTISIQDRSFGLFLSSEQIHTKIDTLASEISTDYKDKDPVFVVVLNGAFLFASFLISRLKFPCRVSFIRVNSYKGTSSSGEIQKVFGMDEELEGEHVILVDDIVDTGLTMKEVKEEILKLKPASVEIACLVSKPESHKRAIDVRYIGFEIPNRFIVGFGLDYNGYGRNLNDIYVINYP
ncbi:MAG: hypoxanthine phosphoribosyltransferase [Cytophagaceae bacterium]